MIKKQFKNPKIIFLIISCIALSSCVSLEHINNYAKNSAESIESFHDINFHFTDYCNSYQQSVLESKRKTIDINQNVIIPDCKIYASADSVLLVFHEVLLSYFNSLANVSDQKLVGYKLDDAAKNLKSLRTEVNSKITDAQITSVQNITNKLLNHLMDNYRKAKIRKILNETQTDLPVVIDGYVTSINALNESRKLSFINYRDSYISKLLENTKKVTCLKDTCVNDTSLKVLIIQDYNKTKIKFDQKSKIINTYIKGLNKIKEVYSELVKNSDHLTSKNLKQEIKKYVDDLEYLKEQIKGFKQTN